MKICISSVSEYMIGRMKSVNISDCGEKCTSCEVQILSNATIEVEFELSRFCLTHFLQIPDIALKFAFIVAESDNVDNVRVDIHGNGVPFRLENVDACKDSGLVCPLRKGQTYTYVQTIPINSYYPAVVLSISRHPNI